MEVDRLRAIALFDGLSPKELDLLSGWTAEVDLPAGRRLLDRGRFAWMFFVIIDGSVEVRRDGDPIATLGPGDVFGEIGLLENVNRTATVETLTPVRAVVMDAREFESMMNAMPKVAARIRRIERARLAND